MYRANPSRNMEVQGLPAQNSGCTGPTRAQRCWRYRANLGGTGPTLEVQGQPEQKFWMYRANPSKNADVQGQIGYNSAEVQGQPHLALYIGPVPLLQMPGAVSLQSEKISSAGQPPMTHNVMML
jgi:hypothetical protein